jgi:hypothetical protein
VNIFQLNITHDKYYSSMGLEGEEVYSGWAYADETIFIESWSIDMPPTDAFVKTSLCDVISLQKEAAVEIFICTALNFAGCYYGLDCYSTPDASSGSEESSAFLISPNSYMTIAE